VVKWWDRFWGAVWVAGSAWIGYETARWFALNATPADLGPLRYALVAFAFIFGLLLGMAGLSLAIIGATVGLERLSAALGHPLQRPAPSAPAQAPSADTTPPLDSDSATAPSVPQHGPRADAPPAEVTPNTVGRDAEAGQSATADALAAEAD
jgi:hypothetical protein